MKKPVVAYVTGYLLSIFLTLLAYFTVTSGNFAPFITIALILSFAVVQLFVQLIFFLHLGSESRPRWRLVTLGFGVLVVGIVVFGSLWIMDNLNYNMMHSPNKMQQYIDKQAGF
ncbi:MAG TPA: cytochrome o ubiquinol oxidase subunit IV [Candidatus Saccharimonadales bacterium]|nr:cytochrome o ubiquinol oxidase subunit IV [Candidatus Saccharimonadales bacterium]